MKYILIGTLLGSIVTSNHDNKEACLGRLEMLKEKGVAAQCILDTSGNVGFVVGPGGNIICGGGIASTNCR